MMSALPLADGEAKKVRVVIFIACAAFAAAFVLGAVAVLIVRSTR